MDVGEAVTQHQVQGLLACGGLEVFLPPVGICGGDMILAIDQPEWGAWSCGLVSAIEVIRQSLFEIAG